MIVATIEISFSKGSAPDLIAHMVEDGRQYCFISDCDLPAGCGADIEIVKPDGLFVIDHCTVDNNRMIVPIPEQATTVRGMAHYIIKVKQTDDAVIFSASGTIWIDDGLITDDMLESIAQVYGLKFPDDFLTTADLTDYVTIQDLAAALQPYALSADIPEIEANPAGAANYDLNKLKLNNVIYKIHSGVTQNILYTATAMTDTEINVDLTAYDEYIIYANDTLPSAQIPQGISFPKSVFQYVLSMSNPNIVLYGYSTAYCSYTVSSNKLTFSESGLNLRIVMIVGLSLA